MATVFVLGGVGGIGALGYYLLEQDNHWCKVVGGTITVLIILFIINWIFWEFITNMISSVRF